VVAGTATVNDNWKWITYDECSSRPVLLANIQTFDGIDPATLRHRDYSADSAHLMIDEESTDDWETVHVDERVGYLAMSPDW